MEKRRGARCVWEMLPMCVFVLSSHARTCKVDLQLDMRAWLKQVCNKRIMPMRVCPRMVKQACNKCIMHDHAHVHVCPCMHGQTSMRMPMLMRMSVHAWSNKHATNASRLCSCNKNSHAAREKAHTQVQTCHAHACMQADTYKNTPAILFLAHPPKKKSTKLWTALILICITNLYTTNSKPVLHADFLLIGGLLEPRKQNLVLLASLMWFPDMVQ